MTGYFTFVGALGLAALAISLLSNRSSRAYLIWWRLVVIAAYPCVLFAGWWLLSQPTAAIRRHHPDSFPSISDIVFALLMLGISIPSIPVVTITGLFPPSTFATPKRWFSRILISLPVILLAVAMGARYSSDQAYREQKRLAESEYRNWLAGWRELAPPDPTIGPQREGEWRYFGAIPVYGGRYDPRPGAPLTSISFHDFRKGIFKPEGLKWLKNEKSLTSVRFEGVLTDEDVVHLRPLDWIERLELINTGVTDAGLAELKTLANLKYLDLRGTPITDASLDVVVQFPALELVRLGGTKVSHEGFQAARWRHLHDWKSGFGMELRRVSK